MSDFGVYVTKDFLDDEVFQEEEKETQKKAKDVNEKKIRVIKIFFWILLCVIVLELIGYKFVYPLFKSPMVTFTGTENYNPEELSMKLISIMDTSNLLNFNCDEATAILSSEAGIEAVSVVKKFPDKIFINIQERKPVALTFVEIDGLTSTVQIDRTGTLFQELPNQVKSKTDLPIISGIPVEYMAGGMKIPVKYRNLIEQIAKINETHAEFFTEISEINVITKESGNYELEIFPANSKVKVLTDRSLNEDAFRYMILLLDVINQLNVDVTEVDLRYGSVSYRTGGEL